MWDYGVFKYRKEFWLVPFYSLMWDYVYKGAKMPYFSDVRLGIVAFYSLMWDYD